MRTLKLSKAEAVEDRAEQKKIFRFYQGKLFLNGSLATLSIYLEQYVAAKRGETRKERATRLRLSAHPSEIEKVILFLSLELVQRGRSIAILYHNDDSSSSPHKVQESLDLSSARSLVVAAPTGS